MIFWSEDYILDSALKSQPILQPYYVSFVKRQRKALDPFPEGLQCGMTKQGGDCSEVCIDLVSSPGSLMSSSSPHNLSTLCRTVIHCWWIYLCCRWLMVCLNFGEKHNICGSFKFLMDIVGKLSRKLGLIHWQWTALFLLKQQNY